MTREEALREIDKQYVRGIKYRARIFYVFYEAAQNFCRTGEQSDYIILPTGLYFWLKRNNKNHLLKVIGDPFNCGFTWRDKS